MNIYLREFSPGYLPPPSVSRYRRTLSLSESFRSVQAAPVKSVTVEEGVLSAEQAMVFRLTALILSLALAATLICASIAHAA